MAHVLALALLKQCGGPRTGPSLVSHGPSCMVVCARRGPKTPLLFLTAVTAASELGLRVLFLSPSPVRSLPAPVQEALAKLSPEALKKIQFKYPGSLDELLHEVASLHESASQGAALPSVIILDGMEHYFGPGKESGLQQEKAAAAAHISALLQDTATFLTKKLEERGGTALSCQVVISFDPEWEGLLCGELSAPDPVLTVVERYFPVRCTLSQEESSAPLQAAARTEEVWHICFSSVGVMSPCFSSGTEDSGLRQLWRLTVCQNGEMNCSALNS